MRSAELRALPLLIATLALAGPSPAQESTPAATRARSADAASEFLAAESAASEEARAANPLVARIEAIRADIAEDREEVLATEASARDARGADLVALRAQAMELRLQSIEKLGELVELVHQLEDEGGDASLYRSQLAELLPRIAPAVEVHLEAAQDSIAKLQEEREAAAPEDRLAIEQRLTRLNELFGRLLVVGVELVEMVEGLEIDAPQVRAFMSEQLTDRARVLSGRIQLLNAQLSDAEERRAAAPDDAGIQADALALQARLDADSERLSSELGLLDRLGLDTAEYKQLLIASTGEITADVFDAEVARGLLSRWIDATLEGIARNGPGFLFKTLLFLTVLFAFWLFSRFVRRIAERAVEAPHLRLSQLLKRMIVSVASGSVLILGVLVALSQLGVQVGPVLAGLGIAGFIVGFALQETLANFAAGVMILAYRPYDVGDVIECAGGVFGKASHMNLVSTTILTFDNQTKVVPNGKIWGDVITNVTAQQTRRVDMVFGISYSDDVAHAEQVLWSIIKEHPRILAEPEPVVKLHELGDSSVNFVARPWCRPDDYWDVYWDVTREVKLRFDREGISIPFPQQDVHLHRVQANGNASPQTPPPSRLGMDRTPRTGRSEPESDD